MAKISTYPIISVPTLNDLLIGTDVENLNDTKNFSLADIGSLIVGNGYVPYTGATQDVDLGANSITASSFIFPGGLSTQFLKADGSVDSTVYQVAGNYITDLSGEATASGPGNATVTLSNSAVIGKVLTGLSVSGGSILATDTIITAFGKLQNQVNNVVGGLSYQGTWNASTNTPSLASGVGVNGRYYIVSVAGTTNLDGITDWNVGDWAIFNGSNWQKIDNSDSVVSVNGQIGIVVLTTTDIAEGTNLYYTNTRARQSISITTLNNSGASTYDNTTGILNIPNYSISGLGGVPSTRQLTINGTQYDLSQDRSWSVGTVTSISTSGPITGGPITSTGTISINQSGASSDGYLSSTDWNTFNNKQNALTNPVTGTGTIYYIPIWSGANSITDSIISYSSSVVNYNFNSASGATVSYINTNGTSYTYTIQMNNSGAPRETFHTYTDGNIVQTINNNNVSKNLSTGQLVLPYYTTTGSFSGTPVGGIAFDNSGNILTTALPVTSNIYTADGTLTGNRVVSLDSKQLIFSNTNATLTNYTYSVGVPTGVTAPTWPSSFVYEGQYNIVPGTGPQIFNTRVWGRNTSATNNNLWVQETFADITSESTSFTNIYNQTFFTGRGSTLDTSTATASVMRGIWSSIGHRYAGSQSTTVQINTNNIQSFYSTIVNYIGNVSNAYGYFSSLSQGSLTTSQTNTLTNHYAFYAEATIGSASGGSSTVTNYYGLFLNTPTVGATGTITNRWGIYAPDSVMNHSIVGNVSIGSTTPAVRKFEVTGNASFTASLASGFGVIFSTTQTQSNAGDVGDGAVSVSHSISAISATNELVIRAMSFGSNNNLTGGGAVTNHRVWNVASSTQTGSITTDLDQIFIERGNQANGTVTNNRAIRVNTMQGTNRASFVSAALSGSNNVYALFGTISIPSGNWGIYQTESNFNNYFSGKVLINTTTVPTELFYVNGSGRFTGILTFTDAAGVDGSGINSIGGNINISGGRGTGNATPGDIVFYTSTATVSGSTLQTLSVRSRIKGDTGQLILSAYTSSSSFTGTAAGYLAFDSSGNVITTSGTGGGGGISRSINLISTSQTAGSTASTDYVYLISGTTTLTLPTAVGNTNRYTLKNVGTNTVTINTTSSQTIDGSVSVTMAVQYTSLDLISDGTNWNII
jgi:thiamine pyrophosphokinase